MGWGCDWLPFRRISQGSGDSATIYTNTVAEGTTPHTIGWIHCINTNANPRFLKLYNKPSPDVGVDTPVFTFEIPGFSPGGTGFTIPMHPGSRIEIAGAATGIGMGLTVNAADNDTTGVAGGEIVVNIGYA